METTKLYNDSVELVFNPAKHLYTVDNIEIQGVTGVCSVINKPALMGWAVKMCGEYALNNLKPGKAYDEIEIEDFVTEMKKAHRRKTSSAASTGTLAHEYLEGAIKFKLGIYDKPPKKPYNQEAINAISAYAEFAKKYEIEYIESEPKVYSKLYGYAGTLDLDARINGKRTIVDFKTSSGIYPEAFLQTAAYMQARQEELGVEYDQRLIIRIGKDGTLETRFSTDFEQDIEAFVAALTLRKRLQEMK